MTEAYPLQWPPGRPRAERRERSHFGMTLTRRNFLKALTLGLPAAAIVRSLPETETLARNTKRYFRYEVGKSQVFHWYHIHEPTKPIMGTWTELDDETLKNMKL